jgi:hypothetical protein
MMFILIAQVASTWAMVGLIWFVQTVHYPLMGHIGRRGFEDYEKLHMSRTTWVVAPLMLIELGSNLALLLPSAGFDQRLLGVGLFLLVVIWLSTYFLQVPQHERLSRGSDELAHRRLVRSNWVRTIAWTARGIWTLGLLKMAAS